MSNPEIIVVTGNQRSGTTVVRQIMAECGLIDVGEVTQVEFENNDHRFYEFVKRKVIDDINFVHPIKHAEIFKQFICYLKEKYETQIVIDLKYNAVRFLDFAALDEIPAAFRILRGQGAKFVHINRRNKLRILVSFQIAMKSDVWGVKKADKRKKTTINLDPTNILRLIDEQIRWSSDITKMIPDAAHLIYEEMFDENGSATDYLKNEMNFILKRNIDFDQFHENILKKQNPYPLSAMISNFEDIKKVLEHTPHSWMLYA